MKLTLLEQPEDSFIQLLSNKISEFNWQHWDVTERLPIAVKVADDEQNIIAGASGRTFGRWLLLERLWVDQNYRGQQLGLKLLSAIEQAAINRGCAEVMLDTLEFQAKDFYLKQGYQVQWTMENYPKTGKRYYMTKQLAVSSHQE